MNDHDTIRRIKTGDQEAYELLVERYYRGLFWHLYAMVKDADWAEDLAQETFVKAYLALDRYNDQYSFSTWLYRIGTNKALQGLRHRQAISLDDIPTLPSTYDPTAAGDVESREALVRQAVMTLPLKYQAVISLYYWRELTYEQIAVVMNTPTGTIKTWLYRAKRQLKQYLENNHG